MIFDEVNTCFKTDLEPISMYVVEIPKSQHNRPDVEEAKKVELNNLMTYETFEEVKEEDLVPSANRIGSRWVITEKQKQDGQKQKVKAQLVARGFQEESKP